MGEKHEEFRRLKEGLADINTDRGGGPDGVKGFYAEAINTANSNLERIAKGIKAREIRLDDNGNWDGKIVYSSGAGGREIQDKVGYTMTNFRKFIDSGEYDGGILRINPDNPIFDNAIQLEELNKMASKHGIKIVIGSVTEKEVKLLSKVAGVEGKMRSAIGLDKKAPVTAEVYTDYKELTYFANNNKVVSSISESDFCKGGISAIESTKVCLVAETAQNLVMIATGEKEMKEGIIDVTKTGGEIFVIGGVERTLANSGNQVLQNLGNNNYVSKVIAISKVMKDSFIKVMQGQMEIDDFILDTTCKGISLFAGSVAGMMGGPIASMIVQSTCTLICEEIQRMYQSFKSIGKEQSKYLGQLSRILGEAEITLSEQRNMMKEYFSQYELEWGMTVQEGFELIINGGIEYNFEQISAGIDKILGSLGKETEFKTVNDVREFMNSSDRVITL